MLEALTIPAMNRLLRANPWAVEKLRHHAHKTAAIACPPFELRVTVTDTGQLVAAAMDVAADVAIEVTPGLLMRAATGDESAWRDARVAGDAEFASTIDDLRRNLAWDYEEDLSRLFGDIAAHRLAHAARGLDRWARSAVVDAGKAVAEYVIHEQPVVVSIPSVESFNRDVDRVRDDVERLEKRLELIQRQLHAT
jgi:ubiquinone biosynthesis protein UbiJ